MWRSGYNAKEQNAESVYPESGENRILFVVAINEILSAVGIACAKIRILGRLTE